ncbi:flagellar hook-length control protein FliK [Clostridium sp.]|uniref:flagellar hook-length control protein FliK n=1 Tax=Clostridium sp. TaxID=1506 RepID=UPI00284F5766|nr:flagellar hook-length control protein FliK [Clostridium sp.]MDR3596058.1 flagellar hook-length control protein FliK [Clostridium sp.]
MPGVWNVGNAYNVNTKKVSSKLTFQVGERFAGRVVEKGQGNDITIKLADGWQFNAELDSNVNLDNVKLAKFQVDGFENGKLKLKLVQNTTDEEIDKDESFQDIIDKEGLSKDDIDVLKNMVKHNIPLTRDNINQIKGLIQFNGRVSANPKEIDAFIQTYLQSKGISADSTEGQATKEMLTKFFNEFKNMTSDDILAFVENNLDFSEESINSFNKLFKGNVSIEQILTKLNDSLNSLEFSEKTSDNKVFDNFINNKLINKEPEVSRNILDTSTALASKIYNENDPLTKKINILDILKTLAGSEDSELNIIQKNANSGVSDSNIEKINLSPSLIEKLDNKEIVKLIKDTMGDDIVKSDAPKTQAEKLIESSNKSKLEELLSNIEGRQVKLTDNEFKTFSELLNNKIQGKDDKQENILNDKSNIQPKEVSTNDMKDTVEIKQSMGELETDDTVLRTTLGGKDEIKAEMKDKINNIRDIVKEIIDKTELKEDGYDKIMNLIKTNISDIKVFNSVSNEYYYLNMPITANLQEYPCKLIIKDNRKDGKKIDTTNAKMIVSVKTAHLGEVDGYLTIRDNRIDVNLKCESDFASTINKNKQKLADGLATLGLFVNVHVSTKDKPVDLVNCRSFFNDLTISAIDIKV